MPPDPAPDAQPGRLPANGTEAPGTDAEPALPRRTLEALVGQGVGDADLYRRALTHRSLLRGAPGGHLLSNERLEFLGDAVLGALIAEALFARFPEKDEGYLTRLRAKLVSGKALARAAQRIGLGAHIRMSENMALSGGRTHRTILADALEAIIGVLYLDQGAGAARAFVERVLLQHVRLDELAGQQDNYKSLLLEHVQARGGAQPRYRVAKEEGPSHAKTFTVEVLLGGRPSGSGTAGSKKKAEQEAAREALARLSKNEAR